MEYEAVIGLEVHAQLLTESKIFCGCSTKFGSPNHRASRLSGNAWSTAGSEPAGRGIRLACAVATQCRVASHSRWARKNYFYPDLPKGYQISMYELPIAQHGHIDITVGEQQKRIGLTRIHMEEDAGKSIHDPQSETSLVDLNRAGVPLLEIVSEPDLRSPEEAGAYLLVCVPSCSTLKFAMAIWRKAACDAMPMFPYAHAGVVRSTPRLRSKI